MRLEPKPSGFKSSLPVRTGKEQMVSRTNKSLLRSSLRHVLKRIIGHFILPRHKAFISWIGYGHSPVQFGTAELSEWRRMSALTNS